MNDKHSEKLSLLKNLITLSQVDNEATLMEEGFIQTIALRIGIGEDELNTLYNKEVDYAPEKKEFARITQLYRLLLLMGVDKENKQNEINFCKEAGFKLGLNPLATNEVIERILASITHTLPPHEIIKIFQTYHN